jgi:hypothetical protein
MSDRAEICKVSGPFGAFAAPTLQAIIDRAAIERDVPKSPFDQRAAPVPSAGITHFHQTIILAVYRPA